MSTTNVRTLDMGSSSTECERETPSPIVVGVDGSAASRAALVWAARQAELTGAPLVAVATWEWPSNYGAPMQWPPNVDFEQDARVFLKETVSSVVADRRIDIEQRVVHGPAIAVLEDQSRLASLVVVGCRGHGELTGMLLGSVSEHLATHAHCPVVIVRGSR
jgi:nucleotide-binding universal stress UspA family protein